MIVNESTFRQTLQCVGVSILYLDNRKAYNTDQAITNILINSNEINQSDKY